MTLPTIIQDRTNDGITIVDFLFAVMRNELAGFKPCHRLDAARLLVKYDCSCKSAVEGCKSAVAERDEALNFTLDYIPDLSKIRSDFGSPDDPYFDREARQSHPRVHRRWTLSLPLPHQRHGRRTQSLQTSPPYISGKRTPQPRLRQTCRPPSFRRRNVIPYPDTGPEPRGGKDSCLRLLNSKQSAPTIREIP